MEREDNMRKVTNYYEAILEDKPEPRLVRRGEGRWVTRKTGAPKQWLGRLMFSAVPNSCLQ